MSGHSHYKSIKYKKGAADAKKSQAFSKISREISVAAKEKGGDPNFNPRLRTAMEKAKNFDMPAENIEKAIKRGTGELEDVALEPITLEAYGPGNVAIIIEGITDNKNRTLNEIKQILGQHDGKLVGEGGARWMFERKPTEWTATQNIEVSDKDKETCKKLFEALDESDDVQKIYSNLQI